MNQVVTYKRLKALESYKNNTVTPESSRCR